ncbi:hypothetical protein PRK78_006196 [Emydomyces testavorans]|uniref:Uncharacterized protein n=1 Tax=Emydomyces testavorans TaxID=2070801 RepID=A0AAF0DM01_9EURO|nr:hypothetical protein PRK78_006196 [Emydomyces testavorans]
MDNEMHSIDILPNALTGVRVRFLKDQSPPRWKRKGDYWRPNRVLDNPSNRLEPMFSSLSVDDWREDNREGCDLQKKPQISPNTRELSFAEIMNGAFDSNCSPQLLKNGASLKPPDPFDIESPNTKPEMDISSPFEKGKKSIPRAPLFGRHTPCYLSSEPASLSVPPNAIYLPPPALRETSSEAVTAGFASGPPLTSEPREMTRLLEMIEQNPGRSKELADLVFDFLGKYPKTSQGTAPKANGTGFAARYIHQNKAQSPVSPQVATIAGGGDSPPRYPNDTFRGHMVERPDVNMGGISSACASGTTTRSTTVVLDDIQANQAPSTPVLEPLSLPSSHHATPKPRASKPTPNLKLTCLHTKNKHPPASPLRGGAGPCCDSWMASYYSTLSSLTPGTLSPEDWRAIRSALAPSPESPKLFDVDGVKPWSHTNSDGCSQSNGSARTASCACRLNGFSNDQNMIAPSSGAVNAGGDGAQQNFSTSIAALDAESFERPSRRELFRHNTTPACPQAPVSSPHGQCDTCRKHSKNKF